MTTMLIGADHRGLSAAKHLVDHLRGQGVDVRLIAPEDGSPRDYPDIAYEVARSVATGEFPEAVLICATGVGMAIAANKVPGVRAAVVHDELTSELSKSHNHANIVCMSADLLGDRLMAKIVDIWRQTQKGGGRHERRVSKIGIIESGADPREAKTAEIEAKSGAAESAPKRSPDQL
ncbi:MAG: ribose 5-phosphate isomerase B [Phycisphaerales bacterium]